MFGPFKPAPHIAELPAEKIDSTYKRLRWQVFAGIFFGYAAYYLYVQTLLSTTRFNSQGLYTKSATRCYRLSGWSCLRFI